MCRVQCSWSVGRLQSGSLRSKGPPANVIQGGGGGGWRWRQRFVTNTGVFILQHFLRFFTTVIKMALLSQYCPIYIWDIYFYMPSNINCDYNENVLNRLKAIQCLLDYYNVIE